MTLHKGPHDLPLEMDKWHKLSSLNHSQNVYNPYNCLQGIHVRFSLTDPHGQLDFTSGKLHLFHLFYLYNQSSVE